MSLPGDISVPRIDNLEGDEHCRFCCSTPGLVIVGYRHVAEHIEHINSRVGLCLGCMEDFGPCPACEMGRHHEFPPHGRGPWGSEGYWKGMPWTALDPTCDCDEKPLSSRDSRARLDDLTNRVVSMIGAKDDPLGRELPPGPCDDCDHEETHPRRFLFGERKLCPEHARGRHIVADKLEHERLAVMMRTTERTARAKPDFEEVERAAVVPGDSLLAPDENIDEVLAADAPPELPNDLL